ncbi:hypothetical protein HUW51_18340 [Adhaeribacter swui]|uniref:DUF4760 domain-containing protein n=1 Tax=Adhaeribacter swui TaxID=2086471 RepID=A0A7G7GBQ8_9BACT|nr:hypothetical protein [Adhaeribacter swui]QNF34592.1 hypothetical protein HUW51_18340 [Adhaeribacter swui]
MSKTLQRNIWQIILISLIFTSIYMYIEKQVIIKIEVLITAIASLITIYLSFVKQKIEDDKVFRELFIDFNNKYSGELNDLLNKLRTQNEITLTDKERLSIIDYFNLCSEEYLWYSKGRIPKSVWYAWQSGILENLSIPVVRNIFEDETNTETKSKSYYGFAEEIKKRL